MQLKRQILYLQTISLEGIRKNAHVKRGKILRGLNFEPLSWGNRHKWPETKIWLFTWSHRGIWGWPSLQRLNSKSKWQRSGGAWTCVGKAQTAEERAEPAVHHRRPQQSSSAGSPGRPPEAFPTAGGTLENDCTILREKMHCSCWWEPTFPRSCDVKLVVSLAACLYNWVRGSVSDARTSFTMLARARFVKRTDKMETRAIPVASEEVTVSSR